MEGGGGEAEQCDDAECVFCVLPSLKLRSKHNLTTFQQTSQQTSRNSAASCYPTRSTIFSITYCQIPVLCQMHGIFQLTLTKSIICIHYSVNLTMPWLSQRIRPKRNCLRRQEESQPRPRRLLLQREVERESSIPPHRKAKRLPKVTPK